jgi:hypothetical protein
MCVVGYSRLITQSAKSIAYLAAHYHTGPFLMLFGRWRLLLLPVSLLMLLLKAGSVQAQVPPLLLGQWEMRQVSFLANQSVPPDILERMDNPEVAELNQEVAGGTAHLLVEFRPDGTYRFSVVRAGQPDRIETGTYSVSGKTLLAQSPATEGGSSFDGQELTQLSRRRLVVTFLVGAELPGVFEEVEYRRVQ